MNKEKFLQLLPQIFLPSSSHRKTDDNIDNLFIDNKNCPCPNLLKLFNVALSCLEVGEIYCEINSSIENNLLEALSFPSHRQIFAYWIYGNQSLLSNIDINKYLSIQNLSEQICIYEGDITTFFTELREVKSDDKIGLCYFDNVVDYRSLLVGLMACRFFLADEAFIVISNACQTDIKNAIHDFQSFHTPEQVKELLVATKEHPTILNLEKDVVILLWQNNLEALIGKRINQQGQSKLIEGIQANKKLLLHVGCGGYRPNALPQDFSGDDWVEIRLDINPNVRPDIIGTITDLSGVPDNSVDAVYSSHNLEHIYNFEVPIALAEFKRVLKPDGFVMIRVPDLQMVGEYLVKGEIEEPPVYQSQAGPISAIDMLYGLRSSLEIGNYYMAHKTGFTIDNFQQKLLKAGFTDLTLIRRNLEIVAYGYKSSNI